MSSKPGIASSDLETEPTHEQIAVAAYHLYLQSGCEDGNDWDHWFRAEQLLRQRLREISAAVVSHATRVIEPRLLPVQLEKPRPAVRNLRSPAGREKFRTRTSPPPRQPHLRERQRHAPTT